MSIELAKSDFVDKVQRLHEIEHGDFKRKVGQYLSSFESSLNEADRRSHADFFGEVRARVIYSPDGNIDQTRRWLIRRVTKI